MKINFRNVFIISAMLALLTLAGCMAMPATDDQSIYNRRGYYQGRIDSQGKIFDRRGYYQGHIDKDGTIFDRRGYRKGRISD